MAFSIHRLFIRTFQKSKNKLTRVCTQVQKIARHFADGFCTYGVDIVGSDVAPHWTFMISLFITSRSAHIPRLHYCKYLQFTSFSWLSQVTRCIANCVLQLSCSTNNNLLLCITSDIIIGNTSMWCKSAIPYMYARASHFIIGVQRIFHLKFIRNSARKFQAI